MIIKKGLYVLEDCNGLPIISMCGPEDYVLQSFKNMLNDENCKNLPDDLKNCIFGGRVRFERVYCDFVHDNDCKKNKSQSGGLINCVFDIKDLMDCDFKIDKKISKKYHKELSQVDRVCKDLEKVLKIFIEKLENVVGGYEDGRNEE